MQSYQSLSGSGSAAPCTRSNTLCYLAVGCLASVALFLSSYAVNTKSSTALYAPVATRPVSMTTTARASTGFQARPSFHQGSAAAAPMGARSEPMIASAYPTMEPFVTQPQGSLQTLSVAMIALGSFLVGIFANSLWAKKPEPVAMMAVTGDSEAESAWRGGQAISALTSSVETLSNTEDILKVLPHRYPFLLVDKVVEFEPKKRAVGIKNVTMNEPHFTGHFPDRPIMPGVLQIEAMAQLGGQVVASCVPPQEEGAPPAIFFFAGITGVRWKKPVVPGDVLVMEMELKSFKERFGIAKMTGKAYVDGKVALEVEEFTFALAK